MAALDKPQRDLRGDAGTLVASAPMRTADVGGWTDTWFARVGVVCNVALGRRTEVRLRTDRSGSPDVRLHVELTGDRYDVDVAKGASQPGRHPMLEQALVTLPPPPGTTVEVGADHSEGSGLGGSASVVVALVAALSAARNEGRGPMDIARLAHQCETGAGREAGVQDHVAAAFGGVSAIDVAYPEATRTAIHLGGAVQSALGRRLLTVVFGTAHSSTEVHREVIERMALTSTRVALDEVRAAARLAIDALRRGDLHEYGRALTNNHEALRSMHPGTISHDVDELAALASRHGATGWKVNGAGGAGGSMAVLASADPVARAALVAAIAARPPWSIIDAPLDPDGVRTEWTPSEEQPT